MAKSRCFGGRGCRSRLATVLLEDTRRLVMDVKTPKADKMTRAPAARLPRALKVTPETLVTLDSGHSDRAPSPPALTAKCVTFNGRALRGRNAA
jgi:hypothetical protein